MQPRSVNSLELIDEFNKGIKNAKFIDNKSVAEMENMVDAYMADFIRNNIDPNDPQAAQKISDEFNKPIDAEGNTIMHYVAQNFNSLVGQQSMMGPNFYVDELDRLNIMALNFTMQYGGDLCLENDNKETPYTISPEMAKHTHDLFPEAISNLETTQAMLTEKLNRVDIYETTEKEFVSKSDIKKTIENYSKRIPILKTMSDKLNKAIMTLNIGDDRLNVTESRVSSQDQYLTRIKKYKDKLYSRSKKDTISRNKAHRLSDFVFEIENVNTNEEKQAIVKRYLEQAADLGKHHAHPSEAHKAKETRAIRMIKDYQTQLFGPGNVVTPIKDQKDMNNYMMNKTLNSFQKLSAQKPLKNESFGILLITMNPEKDPLKKLVMLENASKRHGDKPVLIKNDDNYYIYGLSKNNKWEVTPLNASDVSNALQQFNSILAAKGIETIGFPEKMKTRVDLSEKWGQSRASAGLIHKISVPDQALIDAVHAGHDPNAYRNQQSAAIKDGLDKITEIKNKERNSHNPENASELLKAVEDVLAKTRENRHQMKPVGFDFLSTINADLRSIRNELRHEVQRLKQFPAVTAEQKQEREEVQEQVVESKVSPSQESQPPNQPLPEIPVEEKLSEEELEALPTVDDLKERLLDYVGFTYDKRDDAQKNLVNKFSDALISNDLTGIPALLDEHKTTLTNMHADFKNLANDARKLAERESRPAVEKKSTTGFFSHPKPVNQLKELDALIKDCKENSVGDDATSKFFDTRSKNLTQMRNKIETGKPLSNSQAEQIGKIIKNTREEIEKHKALKAENTSTITRKLT